MPRRSAQRGKSIPKAATREDIQCCERANHSRSVPQMPNADKKDNCQLACHGAAAIRRCQLPIRERNHAQLGILRRGIRAERTAPKLFRHSLSPEPNCPSPRAQSMAKSRLRPTCEKHGGRYLVASVLSALSRPCPQTCSPIGGGGVLQAPGGLKPFLSSKIKTRCSYLSKF